MRRNFIRIVAGLNLRQTIDAEIAAAGIPDVNLRSLADQMAGFLVDSRSENTNKKYFHYFNKWKTFAKNLEVTDIPASPIVVSLYLTQLIDNKCSYSVVSATVYSIKWAHSLKNLADPTDNMFVKNLLEASRRRLTRTVNKKEPVTSEMLIDLCLKYADSTDVLVVRDLCMIVIGFCAFLRYNEIQNLRCNDITFHDDHFSLRIQKSKTDQYRYGNEVVVAKGETAACPYILLKRYLDISKQTVYDSLYLFRPCFRSHRICSLIYKNKPLSYTRARECIVARLKEVGQDLNLGLHSLRSGGATVAANAAVNDRCWKRHGRWKSENSKDGYVADSLEIRLEVSKHLSL